MEGRVVGRSVAERVLPLRRLSFAGGLSCVFVLRRAMQGDRESISRRRPPLLVTLASRPADRHEFEKM